MNCGTEEVFGVPALHDPQRRDSHGPFSQESQFGTTRNPVGAFTVDGAGAGPPLPIVTG